MKSIRDISCVCGNTRFRVEERGDCVVLTCVDCGATKVFWLVHRIKEGPWIVPKNEGDKNND